MQFGVSEAIAHWGKYRSNSSAVHQNGHLVTFGDLNKSVNAVCSHVLNANSDAERVAIAVKSKLELLISIIAVLRVGKSAVILNTGLSDEAINTNIRDTGISCLIYDSFHKRIESLIDTSEKGFSIDVSEPLRNINSNEPPYPIKSSGPNDEWGVLFSSGTTGPPKGVVRDHNSMVTELIGWCLELGLNRHTKFYIGRPIYYTGGLVLALSTLLVGGEIILNDLMDENDPSEVWSDYQYFCASHKVSWSFFIPDQIRVFIRIGEKTGKSYGAEMILTMGGPITGDEKLKARSILGSGIVESWGNTESLGTITEPEDLDDRPNSIGRPFLTDGLYIVDDDCKPMGPFQDGRLAGDIEAGFAEYCNRPEATRHIKQHDLIISEDIGYIDNNGYFYVRGRLQDCIVVNDETLFLPDIEAKLRERLNILECCVVANVSDEVSVALIAVIVLPIGELISESDLLLQANNVLSNSSQLSQVILLDRLPRLPSGKIDKIAVREAVK